VLGPELGEVRPPPCDRPGLMTLLLNYRPVLRQPTGIGVYAQAVLPALQQLPHVLIAGGEPGTAQQRVRRLAWSQWRLQRLARRHHASLIFTPAPEGYLGPQTIPQVVMVHDLRPIIRSDRCKAFISELGCRRCCASAVTSSPIPASRPVKFSAARGCPLSALR